MAIMKWASPFDEMDLIRKEMDSLFNTPYSSANGFSPPVDVLEAENTYRIRVCLPGLPTERLDEHIHLDASQKTLTISGELHAPETPQEEKLLVSQWRYGQFFKQLSFPEGINPEAISASYQNGILEINLPKSIATQKRSIPIQVKN